MGGKKKNNKREMASKNTDFSDESTFSENFLKSLQKSFEQTTNARNRNTNTQIDTVRPPDNGSNEIDRLRLENLELKKQLPTCSTNTTEASDETLKNELELLRLENEQLKRNSISNRSTFSFADLKNSLSEFDGNSDYQIETWLEEFENMSVLMAWNPLEKLVFAKRLLTRSAKTALRTRTDLSNYDKLKDFLLSEFRIKVSSADIHMRLANRKKKSDESLRDYYFAMRELGSMSNIEEISVIKYTINGINDIETNKIILYGATNVAEFKLKLDLYAEFKSKISNTVKSFKPFDKRKQFRCFNCGKVGHESRECHKKLDGPKCFNCMEHGHIAPNCPHPRKPRSSADTKGIDTKETKIILSANVKFNHKLVKINNYEIDALIDTGSDLTLLREDVYNNMKLPVLTNKTSNLFGIGETQIKTLGCFQTLVEFDTICVETTVHVVSRLSLNLECIIGNDVLRGTKIIMNENNVTIEKICDENLLACYSIQEEQEETNFPEVEDISYTNKIKDLITTYSPNRIKESPIKMKILLKSEYPIWQPPRRLSPGEKDEVDRQISEWLINGIVRPSTSEFASPIVLANKKDNTKRICIDYRRLNRQIVMDRFPLPLIEDLIDKLDGAKIFSTLDLENGFFHVPVEEESIKFTAFVTPTGHYEFTRVPFGLCTSPAVFQRYINYVFKDLVAEGFVITYMDDIIVTSKDEHEAVIKIKEVLKVATEYGLKFKWKKCKFLRRHIEFLGYEISEGAVKPSREKIKAVKNFTEPKSLKLVQSFLGLSGYFRKFIKDYASIARPLSDLLRKSAKFEFGPAQRNAFNLLKDSLTSNNIFKIYSPLLETELHTDASKFGFGGILLQRCKEDYQFHPIYYYSKKTTPVQEKYCSYELEVLAIVNALKKFRVYLLGIKFNIVTDCAAFKMTMQKKDIAPRIAGWALTLEDYNYTLEHRPSSKMRHVDALSRNPLVMVITDEFTQRIQLCQDKDENLCLIKQLLQHGPYKEYVLNRDVIFKKDKEGRDLLCVPKLMQQELIKTIHGQGHFGVKKMVELIQREYYISKLREKCETCRRNCILCILAERKAGKQEGFLHTIDKDKYP